MQSSVRKCLEGTGRLVGFHDVAACRHQDHFECRRCRRIFDLEPYPRDLGLEVPPGYRVEGHYVVLRGVCATCAD